MFCQAITEIKKEYDINGVVVGDGGLYEKLRGEYTDIRFVGWKSPEQVQEYIQSARVLVLPSKWYEGAPLTIIEAMSANLPCVVSDCTSATELIEDGINGAIFKSRDTENLKYELKKILDDDAIIQMQANIRRSFMKDNYSEYAHMKQLEKVYFES